MTEDRPYARATPEDIAELRQWADELEARGGSGGTGTAKVGQVSNLPGGPWQEGSVIDPEIGIVRHDDDPVFLGGSETYAVTEDREARDG